MATSKAQLVKNFKAVASYDESELTEAISDVQDENQRKILHELMKKLRDVKTQGLEKKRKSKKIPTVSSDQKFASALEKIKMELDKYEATYRIEE
jgi:hypothetical protein